MSSRFKDLWDKSKDGSATQQRSFLRFAIIALGVFVLFLFIKKDNIITWVSAGVTLNKQNRQIENYQNEIKTLSVFPQMYNTTDEVRSLASSMLVIVACAAPMHAFTHATYFTLRSGGKTWITFLFDCVFLWVVNIPVARLMT
ncbi:MAG: hypothetical protein II205_04480, partial [Bacteroidales bacterium]|nr:hypothetical protein [Bacteroidales bacterium]